MPKRFLDYLERGHLRTHFFRALGLAFVLRSLSAWFVYGPQALDDYKHGVWPGWQHFAGLPLTEFPDYRSRLLVWVLSAFVRAGSWVHITSALGQVRTMYFGLGLLSLLGVVGTYLFARAQSSANVARLSLYLMAAYPLIPFVSTRAFGEAVAMSFVTLGFGALEFARIKRPRSLSWWTFGFLGLGIATLFRFHVGILFVVYLGAMILQSRGVALASAVVAGVCTLIAQALIDLASGKVPMGTLISYLNENEGGGAKYGVSPWYNTWALAAGLLLLPFSLVFYAHLRELWRKQWPVLVSWLAFVFLHGVVAHKEERFLYPILGLEIWALAFLWGRSVTEAGARRVFAPVYGLLTVLGLGVGCFVNSQEGEIGPPADVQSHFDNVVYLDAHSLFGESRIKFYFLRGESQIKNVEGESLTAELIDEELTRGRQAVVAITSDPSARPRLDQLEHQQTEHAHCGSLKTAGSLVDRVLFKMNPKHNQRRRPTWYLVCERTVDD